MRLISALSILHLFYHVGVKTEAECVLIIDQWLENEVQAFFGDFQFFDVGSLLQQITVRQDCDGKRQDIVR